MISIVIRAIIIYILLLILLRLMGKRQIAQMQPFELVLTLVIADLATIPMGELSVPILHGIVPLFTLSIVHFLITILTKKSTKINHLVSGKPIIVINPNGIDFEAINQLKISIDDIFGAIRAQGYFKLEHIEYAIMETNGSINVLPKSDYSPVVNSDLKIKRKNEGIPVTLVAEGSIMKANLAVAGVDEKFIDKMLKKAKITSIKNCVVMTVDEQHNVYVQEKDKKFEYYEAQNA